MHPLSAHPSLGLILESHTIKKGCNCALRVAKNASDCKCLQRLKDGKCRSRCRESSRLRLAIRNLGSRPNMVSKSTASNTKLIEVLGLAEFWGESSVSTFRPSLLVAQANSPSFSWGRGSGGVKGTGASQSVRETSRDGSQNVLSTQKLFKTRDSELPTTCSPHSAGCTRTSVYTRAFVRGLLGTDPPDPTLESASPSLAQGSIWHRNRGQIRKSMSNQCRIDFESMPNRPPRRGFRAGYEGGVRGGLCLISPSQPYFPVANFAELGKVDAELTELALLKHYSLGTFRGTPGLLLNPHQHKGNNNNNNNSKLVRGKRSYRARNPENFKVTKK